MWMEDDDDNDVDDDVNYHEDEHCAKDNALNIVIMAAQKHKINELQVKIIELENKLLHHNNKVYNELSPFFYMD